MKFRRCLNAGLLASAAVLVAGASAASITYNVNQTIGLGSVVGTIQTDGATGVLSASDITAYDLVLNGVGATFTLTNGNSSAFSSGVDLTATPTNLDFNYSGVDDGYLLFQVSFGSGANYYCNATAADLCFQGKTVTPGTIFDGTSQTVPATGNQVIGTTVPEPATWALMLIGAAGIGASLRGKKTRLNAV